MNQDQLKQFILKLNHDMTGQRRCLDLVSILLHENELNISDAKKLLTETIVQFDLTQKSIADTYNKFFREPKTEIKIS